MALGEAHTPLPRPRPERLCGNCLYWHQRAGSGLTGYCRFEPPKVFWDERKQVDVTIWPSTRSSESCGKQQWDKEHDR